MFSQETYIQRRERLCASLKSGIILILGNSDSPVNYPANVYKFRQDSNFLYFFGIDLPDYVGIIDIDNNQHYLFGNDLSLHDIIWTGALPTVQQNALKAGVTLTASLVEMTEFIKAAKRKGRAIHFLPPYRAADKLLLEKLLEIPAAQTKEHASVPLIKAVASLRLVKEPQEIAELDWACDLAYKMHLTAMHMTRPGIYEHEIVGAVEGVVVAHNTTTSFATILSKNGQIFHNITHDNLLQTGDMVLMDAGCESLRHYASDFTRVIPVGGKFSQQQREIYSIVLAANNNTRKISRPNIKQKDIHLEAAKIIASGLKDLGLLRGAVEDIVLQGAHALFFPHGIGHLIGLDAHDMEDLGEDYVGYDDETKRSAQFGTAYLRIGKALQPGYVVSDEPGIYFIPELIDQWQAENKFAEFINYNKVNNYRNFGGIRLEDDLLITETGCRLLGQKRIPITLDEVEAIAGSQK
ncbi:MAG: Xaa-Pro aminopeptidase [Gammaproteobacteria bacterium]|nr:Xaa-Pro aminopeptidase [Gammaproteobacteria bacterium]